MGKDRKLPRHLTEEQVAQVSKTLIGNVSFMLDTGGDGLERAVRNLVAMDVMMFAGLRVGEVVRAKWGDVRADMRALRVRGKGERERVVPLCKRLRMDLRHYRGEFGEDDWERGTIVRKVRGGALSAHQLWRITKGILSATVGEHDLRHPHVLRHTFAMLLYERGVDTVTLSRLLGHASVETTMIYARTSVRRTEHAMKTLDEVAERVKNWKGATDGGVKFTRAREEEGKEGILPPQGSGAGGGGG